MKKTEVIVCVTFVLSVVVLLITTINFIGADYRKTQSSIVALWLVITLFSMYTGLTSIKDLFFIKKQMKKLN